LAVIALVKVPIVLFNSLNAVNSVVIYIFNMYFFNVKFFVDKSFCYYSIFSLIFEQTMNLVATDTASKKIIVSVDMPESFLQMRKRFICPSFWLSKRATLY